MQECNPSSKLGKNSKSLLKLQISTEANAESLDRCGSPQTQKRFKFLAKMVSESNTSSTSLEVELAQYMVELSSIQHDVVASEYWLSRQNLYINLSRLALDLTSVSVSQAYGERVFSVCGDLTARKKKKSSAHLERRVFLKMNTKLLREIWTFDINLSRSDVNKISLIICFRRCLNIPLCINVASKYSFYFELAYSYSTIFVWSHG